MNQEPPPPRRSDQSRMTYINEIMHGRTKMVDYNRIVELLVADCRDVVLKYDAHFFKKVQDVIPKQRFPHNLEACFWYNKNGDHLECKSNIFHDGKIPRKIFFHVCIFCKLWEGYALFHSLIKCPIITYIDSIDPLIKEKSENGGIRVIAQPFPEYNIIAQQQQQQLSQDQAQRPQQQPLMQNSYGQPQQVQHQLQQRIFDVLQQQHDWMKQQQEMLINQQQQQQQQIKMMQSKKPPPTKPGPKSKKRKEEKNITTAAPKIRIKEEPADPLEPDVFIIENGNMDYMDQIIKNEKPNE